MPRSHTQPLDDRATLPLDDDELLMLGSDGNELDGDSDEEILERQEDEDESGVSLKIGIFLTRWPHKYHPGSVILIEVLLALLVLSLYCSNHYHPPSEFINNLKSDPELGFSTRGTEVMKALWTARQLYYNVIYHPTDTYSPYPDETLALKNLDLDPTAFSNWLTTTTAPTANAMTTTPRPTFAPSSDRYKPIGDWLTKMLFAFEPTGNDVDFWDASTIKELCLIVKDQILPKLETKDMTQVYTLGTMIGNIYDKQCEDVTTTDVNHFLTMFMICLDYGIPVEEDENFSKKKNHSTVMPPPEMCSQYRAQLHDVRRFLIPEKYSTSPRDVTQRLDVTMAILATYAPNNDTANFYNKYLYQNTIKSDNVVLTGFHCQDKDLKLHIYEEYMLEDTAWFFLAISFVFIIMFAYLRRLDVLIATILMILMSCVFSYTIFYFVLQMKFFPAINLLAILIIIAVGSDDVFVFYDIFEQTKAENQGKPLELIVAKTFRHAVLSLFVTSLTTSAAFFANTVSDITNIRIFGIFAGSAILVNFVTMILFVPSVVVIVELVTLPCSINNASLKRISEKCTKKFGAISSAIFGYALPKFIEKCWHVCILITTILGVASFVIVFIKPGFQLPVSDDFQVFKSSNAMEHWDLILSGKFLFTQQKYDYKLLKPFFIFGFLPDDPGDHLNPLDTSGNLTVDNTFDFYDFKTQLWMQKTCNNFKNAPFGVEKYMDSFDCGFDAYTTVANQVCSNPLFRQVLPKCCASKQPPFKNLETCLPLYQALAHNRIRLPGIPAYPKPILDVTIFHPRTNKVVGYVLHIKTQWYNSYNYDIFAKYYYTAKDYFQKQKKTGPNSIQNGFMAFTQWVWFWDLQNSLYSGTYYSIGMSLAVSTVVMLLTSLNGLITCYAMVTIAMAIASTVAAIVLMGWSLSVIESVIISLSVGLSIDFTIHYGVAYRLSKKPSSNERVKESFKTVGAAVAMAALTTFTSGAAMMPCRVLPYLKLGTFLMLVMAFAWIYATFMFQSICRIIGPRGNFCQIRFPKRLCNKTKSQNGDPSVIGRIRLAQVDTDDLLLSA